MFFCGSFDVLQVVSVCFDVFHWDVIVIWFWYSYRDFLTSAWGEPVGIGAVASGKSNGLNLWERPLIWKMLKVVLTL